jgi:hypothetical protein
MKTTPTVTPDPDSAALPQATDLAAADGAAPAMATPTAGLPGPLVLQPGDFYLENGRMVFTATFHLRRGYCCCSRCRHCPYRDWSR